MISLQYVFINNNNNNMLAYKAPVCQRTFLQFESIRWPIRFNVSCEVYQYNKIYINNIMNTSRPISLVESTVNVYFICESKLVDKINV